MSYRSYEQSSPAVTGQTIQRKRNVAPGSIIVASNILRKNRFLLPVGAVSASLALGISAYARGERISKTAYKIPFVTENSILRDPELKKIFQYGNSQHLYNSLAIMASPFTSSKPLLTSSLLIVGIGLFCGTEYYRTFKEQPEHSSPLLLVGGLCLLTGWLTFLL